MSYLMFYESAMALLILLLAVGGVIVSLFAETEDSLLFRMPNNMIRRHRHSDPSCHI